MGNKFISCSLINFVIQNLHISGNNGGSGGSGGNGSSKGKRRSEMGYYFIARSLTDFVPSILYDSCQRQQQWQRQRQQQQQQQQ